MKNIAVFISGKGTNLQALIDASQNRKINGKIVCVISNKKNSYGLIRAKKNNIPFYLVSYKNKSKHLVEHTILNILKPYKIDLIVLAGYLRLLSSYFINHYKNKIINIHPSLLPSFPGLDSYKQAWDYGVKISGCTVHFVDEGCDTGPIILQSVNPVYPCDTFESFKSRGLKIEHKSLVLAVKLFCEDKIILKKRRVIIK